MKIAICLNLIKTKYLKVKKTFSIFLKFQVIIKLLYFILDKKTYYIFLFQHSEARKKPTQ